MYIVFFFNDTATTEIYTLSLHDALPISSDSFVHLHVHTEYSMLDGAAKLPEVTKAAAEQGMPALAMTDHGNVFGDRKSTRLNSSHRQYLVCRLLLEKKNLIFHLILFLSP